jgi:phospholipid/cholesterol/gamma-HCH transport system substrate-binding protein
MQSFWTPLRVGLVVALAAAAFGFGLYLIGANTFGRAGTYRVYAIFDDATGLGVRSRVQIAGIVIGQVDEVVLEGDTAKARVWLKIQGKYVLHRNASIAKRSESILGDFLLDVNPGTSDQPPLKDGDEIRNVIRQPGMNEVFQALNKIAGDIGDITGNLRKVLGGEAGEENIRTLIARLLAITQGIQKLVDQTGAKLDATIGNFQKFSGDLAKLTGQESPDIVAILQNTRDATAEARDILRTIGDVVGTQAKQGDLKEGVKSLKDNLAKLDTTLQNVQEITTKINKGEGTIGHLVNDDTLAKNLDRASTQLNGLLGGINTLKIELSERSEFLLGAPGGGTLDPRTTVGGTTGAAPTNTSLNFAYNPWTKNYFGIRIIPRPDKWYGFEIIDDPRGLTTLTKTQNVSNCPTTLLSPTTTSCFPNFPAQLTTTTTERQLKFSVYLAKRYGAFSGRFGIIENTGGFGLKAYLFNDALTFSVDAFDFANPLKSAPRVKFYVDYRFFDHLLITAGTDDFLNTPYVEAPDVTRITTGRDFFVGAGIFFSDEDISRLIGLAAARF